MFARMRQPQSRETIRILGRDRRAVTSGSIGLLRGRDRTVYHIRKWNC